MPGFGQAQRGAAGLQDHGGRDHGQEDAAEQGGDFQNGAVGEGVRFADLAAGAPDRQAGQGGHGDLAGVVVAEVVDFGVGREQQHRRDHAAQQQEVPGAFEAQRFELETILLNALLTFLAVEVPVHDVEHDQQDDDREQPDVPEVLEGPEEGDPAQVPQEQGGVADGRQGAADVADQEDEEQGDVLDVLPLAVGAQHGADQQHRRAGGADDVGDQRADRQERGVCRGLSFKIALEQDAAADDEERAQQGDERDVLLERVGQAVGGGLGVVVSEDQPQQVADHGGRPCGRHQQLVAVLLPPVVGNHGKNGDAQEHAGEGQDPQQRELIAEPTFTCVSREQAHHCEDEEKSGGCHASIRGLRGRAQEAQLRRD